MKTALVKQAYDVFGPWSGVLWKDTSPTKLFEVWPGKAVYWELTCMLEADWYIIPHQVDTDYIRDAVQEHPGRAALIRKHTSHITPINSVPLQDYDLVITFDAILQVPANSRTLFAYYAQEHWDALYQKSLCRPVGGYDLFLDHMLSAPSDLHSLPQAVSFPYIHDLPLARSLFSSPRRESAWVDWRTVMTLAMKTIRDSWSPEADAALSRLQQVLGLPIINRTAFHAGMYGFSDPPAWGDAFRYLQEMSQCKYYIAVGNISGAGQGLAEAATLGCLCIGQREKSYHRLVCHPACLCEDLAELPERFRNLAASTQLQREVASHQDHALQTFFRDRPLEILRTAIALKQNKLTSRSS